MRRVPPRVCMAALLAWACPPAAATAAPTAPYASAWVAPFDAFSSEDWACFDEIDVFALAFDARQRPFVAYPRLLARAAAARPPGVALYPVIVNDVWGPEGRAESGALKSPQVLSYWLGDARRRDQHVDDLDRLATPFDGIELDYERVPDDLWGAYTEFIEKLADKLHAQGKGLHVNVESGPLYARGGEVARRWLIRVGEAADKVKIMTYYERGEFSAAPGPGSSLEFVGRTGRRALDFIPKSKIVLALTLAATDFEVPLPVLQASRRVRRLHFRAARELLAADGAQPLWDDVYGAPYFTYIKEGARHEVWYEDERTLGAKIAAAAGLGEGVGLWYLGTTRPDLRAMGLCRGRHFSLESRR